MASGVLRVMLEVLAVDEGLWCRRCLLPSGARFWCAVTIGPRVTVQAQVQCRDCGGHDIDTESGA